VGEGVQSERIHDLERRVHDLERRVHDLDIEPARYLNLVLGAWTLVSAFLWRHSEPQFLVTIVVGGILAIVAPWEVGSRRVRTVNIAAGGALALAAVTLPHTSMLTVWHNLILGLFVVGISFFGPPHGKVRPRPEAPEDAYEATGGV
jgi:hypothetical protein